MLDSPEPLGSAPAATSRPVSYDEGLRIAAVRRHQILDTPADGSFDNLATLAAQVFDVPMAVVSIVDTDRIWFKARHGLDVHEIGRDPGLCASAIMTGDTWVVTDAAVDPRTLTNPLVSLGCELRNSETITSPRTTNSAVRRNRVHRSDGLPVGKRTGTRIINSQAA